MELSTISWRQWLTPAWDVVPMYIPGRLRTGSSPSSTTIEEAPYDCFLSAIGVNTTTNSCGRKAAEYVRPKHPIALDISLLQYSPIRICILIMSNGGMIEGERDGLKHPISNLVDFGSKTGIQVTGPDINDSRSIITGCLYCSGNPNNCAREKLEDYWFMFSDGCGNCFPRA